MTLMRIQLVLDTRHDADLLTWLGQQPNKSAAIRTGLRAALRDERPALDVGAIRVVIRTELERALSGAALVAGNADDNHSSPPVENPALAAALDSLF
jgi:hypothetical protein